MDKKLAERRKQAEDRFNRLNKQKVKKDEEINEIVQELVKIQGEVRVLDELIAAQKTKTKNISTEADTLNIEEPTDAQT